MTRTSPCSAATRRGRLDKAQEFLDAARALDARTGNAYVSLCVHAGIAAADVICCARLGEHAAGEGHEAAVRLLAQAHEPAAKHLQRLLRIKTKAEYSPTAVSSDDVKRAGRAASALVDHATGL